MGILYTHVKNTHTFSLCTYRSIVTYLRITILLRKRYNSSSRSERLLCVETLLSFCEWLTFDSVCRQLTRSPEFWEKVWEQPHTAVFFTFLRLLPTFSQFSISSHISLVSTFAIQSHVGISAGFRNLGTLNELPLSLPFLRENKI